MEPIRVVIRYVNGKIIKGTTNDFFPNKPVFHVHAAEGELAGKSVEVAVKDLKAVFFVRDFTGRKEYQEQRSFPEGQKAQGRKVEVTFKDGETLVGATLGYDASRPGFFVVPADPQSNNLRAFVVTLAVKAVSYL